VDFSFFLKYRKGKFLGKPLALHRAMSAMKGRRVDFNFTITVEREAEIDLFGGHCVGTGPQQNPPKSLFSLDLFAGGMRLILLQSCETIIGIRPQTHTLVHGKRERNG
jgi:hypothetical protein